jgi:dsDNA-binding SOS-regulon protein
MPNLAEQLAAWLTDAFPYWEEDGGETFDRYLAKGIDRLERLVEKRYDGGLRQFLADA